jgi:threonine synthase
MNRYQYRCFDCGRTYAPEQIENEFIYLCPACGTCERNTPLKGVLEIIYDYDLVKKSLSREKLLATQAGQFWLHHEMYPITAPSPEQAQLFEKMRLSQNPVAPLKTKEVGTFLAFDDTLNPTLSYKDRATSLVLAKAVQMNITEIAAASTGNAGSSLAGLSARLGIKAHVFCPERIPLGKRIQIQAFGASIYLVKGSYDDAFDLCLDIAQAKKWYNRNTAYNPLTIEGKKSSSIDLFIALQGKLPDVVFVPTGDGVIISGIYKGFYDLHQLGYIEKLPRLIAVQAEGSDALYRFMQEGKFEFQPADTVADSISAGAPRNLYMAAHAVSSTGGETLLVSDEEILQAQQDIIRETGLMVEPAASASYAGLRKYKANGKLATSETALVMFTGNGLKDPQSLSVKNPQPEPKAYQDWVSQLK